MRGQMPSRCRRSHSISEWSHVKSLLESNSPLSVNRWNGFTLHGELPGAARSQRVIVGSARALLRFTRMRPRRLRDAPPRPPKMTGALSHHPREAMGRGSAPSRGPDARSGHSRRSEWPCARDIASALSGRRVRPVDTAIPFRPAEPAVRFGGHGPNPAWRNQ